VVEEERVLSGLPEGFQRAERHLGAERVPGYRAGSSGPGGMRGPGYKKEPAPGVCAEAGSFG